MTEQQSNLKPKPTNIAAERAVLSGLAQYGSSVLTNISDIVTPDCFDDSDNQALYKCLLLALEDCEKVDISSLFTAGASLGFNLQTTENTKYIRSLYNFQINEENVRKQAIILKKLSIARKAQNVAREMYRKLAQVSGMEPINDILNLIEGPAFEFGNALSDGDTEKTELIGEGVTEYIANLEDNKGCPVGIPSPFPRYNQVIGKGRRRGYVYLIGARPKCLSIKHNVYTPSGKKNICDLKVGDLICHPDGTYTSIKETYQPTNKKCYEVIFKDGTKIICSEDHLWSVTHRNTKKTQVKSTIELSKKLTFKKTNGIEYLWDIETPKVEFQYQQLPIEPYVLGCLLGDGSLFHTAKLHSADKEIIDKIEILYPSRVKIDRDIGKKCITYRINGLLKHIQELGLHKKNCYNKFIPVIYKYCSSEQRLKLLQGLMDTDGTIKYNSAKSTRCQYTTVSKQLALDVQELVESLGGIANIRETQNTCQSGTFPAFLLEIRFNDLNPFSLSRKANRLVPRTQQVVRTISEINYIGIEKCVCITTNREDGLFITDNCVITHNCGKSTFAINDALHVAGKLGIPVLYLDSEMSKEGQWPRMLANISNITINDIEDGKFADNLVMKTKLKEAEKELKELPIYYRRIAGKPFEEILSIIRRWVIQDVGQEDGRTKDCLIIYDYFKLMDSSALEDMQEYQAMGFQIQELTNFCNKYDVPCSAFIQLNRDGITKETSDIISQSDRLLWLCASFAIFKRKTPEEIMNDGFEHGNVKLIPTEDQRFGAGLEQGDYINIKIDRDRGKMTEGLTAFEVKKQINNNGGFETVDDNDDDEGDKEEF